ncbi:hypothetical protein ARTHRO9V_280024 [Arthrobacter sp. 9V]|nr:hypothetical protein ARTHRO9V_280024 [Arthrobacter sp. 9V]
MPHGPALAGYGHQSDDPRNYSEIHAAPLRDASRTAEVKLSVLGESRHREIWRKSTAHLGLEAPDERGDREVANPFLYSFELVGDERPGIIDCAHC